MSRSQGVTVVACEVVRLDSRNGAEPSHDSLGTGRQEHSGSRGDGDTVTCEGKQAVLHIRTDPAQKPWQVTSGIGMDSRGESPVCGSKYV